MSYLKLIRFPNLVILAIMQLVFRFGFFAKHNLLLALSDFQFILLVIATVCLAAAGYVINDIFDQEIDQINKPKQRIVGILIPEEKAYYLYSALNIVGVAIGMYVSNSIQKPAFLSFFIFIAALLYFYATTLKSMFVIGNIIVSSLVGFSVIILGFFDLYPTIATNDLQTTAVLFSILKDYAIFAFAINLIREIIKDCQDIIGDKSENCKTIPIVLGLKTTNKINAVLLLLIILYLLYYCYSFLMFGNLIYATIYLFITVIAPLIYCFIKVFKISDKTEYKSLSTILKMVLLFGILTIALSTYLLKNTSYAV